MTAELMLRAQGGDIDAFAELYARYRDPVFRLARKYLPDHAEDITQDVFVKALAKLDSWHDQGKDPLAWLYTITVNLCRSKARSAHETRSRPVSFADHLDITDLGSSPSAEQLVVGDLISPDLLAALAALSYEQREVIVLFDLMCLHSGEIAERLGIGMGAVRSRLYRARQTLAALLADRGLLDA